MRGQHSERGFFSFAGLFLAVLVTGFLAYFMMKAYSPKAPVNKAAAASLNEAGIRTDSYGALLNSVRGQVGDLNKRQQAIDHGQP
jgi:hypothetical protein